MHEKKRKLEMNYWCWPFNWRLHNDTMEGRSGLWLISAAFRCGKLHNLSSDIEWEEIPNGNCCGSFRKETLKPNNGWRRTLWVMINESRGLRESQFNCAHCWRNWKLPEKRQTRTTIPIRFMMFLFPQLRPTNIKSKSQKETKRGFVCAFAMLLCSVKFIVCVSLVQPEPFLFS